MNLCNIIRIVPDRPRVVIEELLKAPVLQTDHYKTMLHGPTVTLM